MSFLSNLNWRFATKSFDPNKTVSDEKLEQIKEAIRMAPSSFGLQAFHVEIITDAEVKKTLREHSWNQPQVTDCSHLLVFSARTDLPERIEQLLELMSGGDAEKKEALHSYANMMRGFAEGKNNDWVGNWGAKQAYIALGFAMAACAEIQIDSCPMEGLDAQQYDEILKHPEHLKTVVILPIGYRAAEPDRPKVRFPESDLFS